MALLRQAQQTEQSLLSYTQIVYALQALPVIIALLSGRNVVRAGFALPSIIAVIMSYARLPTVAGTFLESHHRWLIRTFWIALTGYVALWIVTLPLKLVLIGFPIFYLGLTVLAVWIIYRLVRGWLALHNHRPI
jgi:uncharacterized membrane protein